MLKKFVDLFKANLAIELAKKTSWGRNDLMNVINETIAVTMIQMLE